MASDTEAIETLSDFAFAYASAGFEIHGSIVSADERQDGEPVTRVTLLVTDPTSDTWNIDEVRELRQALGRKATELGLPAVSLTLVPSSEADTVTEFAT